MTLRGYALRRLALFPPTLLGVTVIVFIVSRVIPGDPAQLAAGDQGTPAMITAIRQEYGLDQPLWMQYLRYLWGLVRGDLGTSVLTHRPVLLDLVHALPATLELTAVGLMLAVVLGVAGGVLAAVYHDKLPDHVSRVGSIGAVSMPRFWLALMLQLVFAATLHLVPIEGRFSADFPPPQSITGLYLVDSLLIGDFWRLGVSVQHIILPAIALSVGALASILRMTRATLLETLSRDYIRTATSVGLPRAVVVMKYALKNALIPSVTVIGNAVIWMLAGAVLVETVFDWPGLGLYVYRAVLNVDYQPIASATLIVGLLVAIVNLTVDLLYGVLDPRIRYG